MADMEKKKISELDSASSINLLDYFEVSEPQNGGQSYESKNITIEQLRNYIFESAFPVGSIYMSVDSEFNPHNKFGGDWELFAQGRTIFGVDGNTDDSNSSYKEAWGKPLKEGGSSTLTLDENTMPAHRHNETIYTNVDKGAIEFAIRHPYDPNDSVSPSIYIPEGRGAASKRGSTHHWNTGTVCKSQSPSSGDNYKNGDKISIKLPAIQTSVTIAENGSGADISLYPPYVTCYIWRRTA